MNHNALSDDGTYYTANSPKSSATKPIRNSYRSGLTSKNSHANSAKASSTKPASVSPKMAQAPLGMHLNKPQ